MKAKLEAKEEEFMDKIEMEKEEKEEFEKKFFQLQKEVGNHIEDLREKLENQIEDLKAKLQEEKRKETEGNVKLEKIQKELLARLDAMKLEGVKVINSDEVFTLNPLLLVQCSSEVSVVR